MPKTKVRATQFKTNDITTMQMADNAIIPSKMASATVNITSSNGVITLTGESNSFAVDGTEIVTDLTGIDNGFVSVKWMTSRSLTHTTGKLELYKNIGHSVCAGDTSLFVMRSGVAEEVGFKSSVTEQQSSIYEFTAATGQKDFVLNEVPLSKNNMLVILNGILQATSTYTFSFKTVTLQDTCEAGDVVTVIVLEKALVPSEEGVDVVDGGTF